MLKINKYEGKNFEQAIEVAVDELNCPKEKMFIIENEVDGGLFKSKKVELTILTYNDLVEFLKEYFNNLSNLMDIDIKQEIKIRDNIVKINLITSNNSIMIGNRGRTLHAIRRLLKQTLNIKNPFNLIVNIDISNYNEKKYNNFEREINKIANEVNSTKIDVELDPMNSFQRRIVHNVVNQYDNLETISKGVSPERYVVIKYKED